MNDKRQMLVAVMAAVLVTVLFFMLILKPKMDQIAETREQIEQARSEETDLRQTLSELRRIQRDAVDLTAQLQAVAGYLPSTPNLPDFIRLVQGAATRSGVDLRSIAPTPPVDRTGATGIDEIIVTLVALGGFHRVEDFVARLERLPRVVVVRAISLSPQTDALSGRTILSTTLTLKMFVVQPTARIGTVSDARPSPSPAAEAS